MAGDDAHIDTGYLRAFVQRIMEIPESWPEELRVFAEKLTPRDFGYWLHGFAAATTLATSIARCEMVKFLKTQFVDLGSCDVRIV